MQIRYNKSCDSEDIIFGGKRFEELTQEEIKDIVFNLLRTEGFTKDKVKGLVELFGQYTKPDSDSCETCGDFNYEIIWK